MAVTTTYIWVTTPWNVDVRMPKIVNLLWVEQIYDWSVLGMRLLVESCCGVAFL